MLSKKYYVIIAEILNHNCPTSTGTLMERAMWEKMVFDFARVLKEDNPRFDKDRFIDATGLKLDT